jgi:hypothetical protein
MQLNGCPTKNCMWAPRLSRSLTNIIFPSGFRLQITHLSLWIMGKSPQHPLYRGLSGTRTSVNATEDRIICDTPGIEALFLGRADFRFLFHTPTEISHLLTNWLFELSPSWAATSLSATRERTQLLWNLKLITVFTTPTTNSHSETD